jgi:hypothetical protein
MAALVAVKHEDIQRVKDALASVQSNGQALAACGAAMQAARKLADVLRSEGGAIRQGGAKDLEEYSKRVEVAAKALAGNPTTAVGESWAKAKEQVLNLYMLVFVTQFTEGAGREFADRWSDALSSAVTDLPKTIGAAAKVAAKAVQTIVTETAKVGGSLVWGVFAGAWPLILIVAALGVGYLVIRKKLPVLP